MEWLCDFIVMIDEIDFVFICWWLIEMTLWYFWWLNEMALWFYCDDWWNWLCVYMLMSYGNNLTIFLIIDGNHLLIFWWLIVGTFNVPSLVMGRNRISHTDIQLSIVLYSSDNDIFSKCRFFPVWSTKRTQTVSDKSVLCSAAQLPKISRPCYSC